MASAILPSVGVVGERFVPQILLDHVDTVGLGEAGPLVGRAELHVVAGLGQHLGDRRLVERAGVGESGAAVADDADADAFGLGADEVLDLAFVDADVGLGVARHEGLDLLARLGHRHHPIGDRLQLARRVGAHAAVPPIVSALTRSVG